MGATRVARLGVGALTAALASAAVMLCLGHEPALAEFAERTPDGGSNPAASADRATIVDRQAVATNASAIANRAGAPPRPVRVVLRDGDSKLPLAGVATRLYRAGAALIGPDRVEFELDADGSVTLTPAQLEGASYLGLSVVLPEFEADYELPVRLPSGDDLRARHEPLVLDVERGHRRALRIVDATGAPIAGAIVSSHAVRQVATDADGIAWPVLPSPPQAVDVFAPSYRQLYVQEPPAEEPWVIVLPRANRLELTLAADCDRRGMHAEVLLSKSFGTRQFYQSHYVQTPGRAVEGTPGFWSGAGHGPSAWSLGFPPHGPAVLDQLCDGGTLEAQLWRFGELLERRALELPAAGGAHRIAFASVPPAREIDLHVVGPDGTPCAGVEVIAAVPAGAWIDAGLRQGVPPWAPRVHTDAHGRASLPAAADAVLLVLVGDGLAVRILDYGELRAMAGAVRLSAGCTVRITALDRDGCTMVEEACGNPARVEPYVELAHGVRWRAAAGTGDGESVFAALPPDVVAIRFTYLDEVLHHDARVPVARFHSRYSVADLQLGK